MKIKNLIAYLQKLEIESPNANIQLAIFDPEAGCGRHCSEDFRVVPISEEDVYLEMDVECCAYNNCSAPVIEFVRRT